MKQYQVIGGQYEQYWYGESNSIIGAKRIASQNCEFWDNWQGWHYPSIYKADDCEKIISKDAITVPNGCEITIHKIGVMPIATRDFKGWTNLDNYV